MDSAPLPQQDFGDHRQKRIVAGVVYPSVRLSEQDLQCIMQFAIP